MKKQKLIRTSTVSMSLDILLKGQLSFLNNYYNVIAVSGEDDSLESVRKREKVRTRAVSIQRPISPLKDIVSLYKLYRTFREEKPFIVHSITPKAGLLSMTAAYFAGVPIRIHTFTGLIFPSKKGLMQKILIVMDRILCRFATHIYPEGNGVKNDLLQYKITQKPLRIIANGNVNGIDVAYYNPELFLQAQKDDLRNKLGIDSSHFVFVFVGRLVGDKGINELVNAFSALQKEKADCKLILVGPKEEVFDPLLPETIHEIEHNSTIISVGYQNDVRPYFAISDALVFPSYREGFPNVVMQAGAMGLPSIVTNINGCNEIIEDGVNGVIIPVKNSDVLYEAMQKMMLDTNLRIHLQENARGMIVSRYEQQVVWNAILAEYKSLEQNV